MKFALEDYTKNNYKTPQRPLQELLVEMGWGWSIAGKTANEYSMFEVEQAIKAAKIQSTKQGKNLVTPSYILAILKKNNKPYGQKNNTPPMR